MPEFLTEEWFEALSAGLKGLSPPSGAGSVAGELSLGQIITEVPADIGPDDVHDREVRFTILIGPKGGASLVRGSTDTASVTLVEDWSTASAIVSGSCCISDLLAAGKIKLRGDSRALVSAEALLTQIARLVADALGDGQDPPS